MKALRFLQALPLALSLLASPILASQATIVTPTVGPLNMAGYANDANAAFLAIQGCNSGSSAPANGPSSAPVSFQFWCDTTTNPVVVKMYDGSSWVVVGKLNTSSHIWTPSYQGTDLGTASTATTGTSGHTVPFLDGVNTISGAWNLGTPSAGVLTNTTGLPISTGVAGLGTGIATALAVNVGSAGSPVVNGGALGTPSSGTLTNGTGLPISTGVSGLATGVATFLGTPSSANLRAALTDEVGTGAAYFVGGALGTPASGTLTNGTGLPISTGLSGAGTGVLTALGVNVGTAGAFVANGGALGTPSSGTLTNETGLPISTGLSGAGAGVLTAMGNATNATGGFYTFSGALGTPISGTLTNATGLPISTGLTGAGTGVLTALGVNVGSAGAPVVNGGALGTPTSGTLTNETGLPISSGVSGLGTGVAAALGNATNASGGVVTSARNISTGCGLTGGGDLSADRTLKLSLTINAQTGTSYTVLDGDCGKLVSLSNASAVAVSLPQANGSTFVSGWSVDFQNKGAGTVTVTPVTSTINGGASLALTQNQGMHCSSDGSNYTCVLGVGAGGGSGTVTNVATAGLATGGPISASGTITVTAATKSDEQAGTSAVLATTPSQQQSHASAAKAWVSFNSATAAINASYNISGVVHNAAGAYTVSFSTAFSTANYVCTGSGNGGGTNMVAFNTQAAGSIGVSNVISTTGTPNDPVATYVVCFGAQ